MTSKEKIIQAALAIFAVKGKHGATMEEIAARARINKAMVYYYFGNRDNLFRQVLVYIFTKIFNEVLGPLSSPRAATEDVASILEKTMRRHFRLIAQNPTWARLVFHALINEEEDLCWAVEEVKKKSPELFPLALLSLIEKGIAENKLRPVDPVQTAVSIAGMNVIYFLSRPIAKILFALGSETEEAFLRAREDSVVDLIFNGLRRSNKNERRPTKLGSQLDKTRSQESSVYINYGRGRAKK